MQGIATVVVFCVAAPVVGAIGAEGAGPGFVWEPVFRGVELTSTKLTEPLPLALYALRIDLSEPTIEFVVTPSNGDQPLETDSRTATTFANELGCQAAVNASPFSPVVTEEGVPQDVVGISMADGDMYSAPQPDLSALLIGSDNRAWCAMQSEDLRGARHAVGGFGKLVESGRNVGDGNDVHPRTAAGVTEDGRYLILLVVDGRQPDHSMGATTADTAEWMLRLGCHDAVNLDGGGSTTLVLAGPDGRARIINRPIHENVPGRERPSANHLGLRAQPLAPQELSAGSVLEAR